MRTLFENLEKALMFVALLFLTLSDSRVMLFDVPVYLPEIIVFLMLIIHGIRSFGRSTSKRRIPSVVFFASALLFLGVVLSAIMNGFDRDALGAIKSWFLFPMVFCWLIFRAEFNKKDIWIAFSYWFFGVALVAFVALFLPGFSSETYDGRLHSVFPSPNHLGFFLEYGVILGVGLIILMKKSYLLYLLVFMEAAIVTALLLTESDGALFSAAMGVAVLLVVALLSPGFSKKIIGFGSIFMIFIGIVMFFSLDWDAFGSGLVRDSLASRVMIWNASVRVIGEHPLFGIGPRNFQEEYLALQSEYPPYLEWAVPHPHNIFLAFWLFTGSIGLFGFVVLISAIFRIVMRVASSSVGEAQLFSGILLGLLVAFLFHGMVDTPYFRNDLSYMFWAIVAFTLVSTEKKTTSCRMSFQVQAKNLVKNLSENSPHKKS